MVDKQKERSAEDIKRRDESNMDIIVIKKEDINARRER